MLEASTLSGSGRAVSVEREKVLLIEDEPDVRETLAEILVDEGYDVTQAPEGRTALQRLAGQSFDVILLDLMMPVMDGTEFLRQARETYRDLPPVIVLTALNPGRVQGAARQLRKPYHLDDLFDALEDVLDG